ncbi:MAG: AAA family ATPase [Acidimicrobiia bacterium]
MRLDRSTIAALGDRVVGRRREIELIVAALAAERHILLEGPPGTGKSTLLRALADALGLEFTFVEGNAELTPARLVGHFDPAQLLEEGYRPDVFVDGPLVAALRKGSLLYIEEINRVPEETLNLLITVMSEGELHVPRLGVVRAGAGFRLVAAMNPFDAVGTARISAAVYDRVCRLAMGYQTAGEEASIVRAHAGGAVAVGGPAGAGAVSDRFLATVVDVVRATRDHPEIRVGSSVRGAIDLVRVASSLAELRGARTDEYGVGLDAALVALSGRIRLHEASGRSAEELVAELWERFFGPPPAEVDGEGDEPAKASDPGKS